MQYLLNVILIFDSFFELFEFWDYTFLEQQQQKDFVYISVSIHNKILVF